MTIDFHIHIEGSATETVLHGVKNYTCDKTSDISNMPVPGSDSNNNYAIDNGVIRKITVSGLYNDTLANISTFINTIESGVDGEQFINTRHEFHSGIPYNGGSGVDYNVMIKKFSYSVPVDNLKGDGTYALSYTIEMVEVAP